MVTVDVDGTLTAVAPGVARITGQSQGFQGSSTVTVVPVQISSNVIVVDSLSAYLVSTASQIAAGTLIFRLSGAGLTVNADDVLVVAQGGGLLRRAQSVQATGSTLRVETSQAYLGDVLQNGVFGGTVPVELSGVSGVGPSGPSGRPGSITWPRGPKSAVRFSIFRAWTFVRSGGARTDWS